MWLKLGCSIKIEKYFFPQVVILVTVNKVHQLVTFTEMNEWWQISIFLYRYFSRNEKSHHRHWVNLSVPPPIFTSAAFSTSAVNRMGRWQGGRARRVHGDRRILKVISVDVGPRIGVFSLHGCVWQVSSGEKGVSAEGENIDILRKNTDA